MKRLRAGVNTNRASFFQVYPPDVREAIASLVDVDFQAIPEEADERSIAASLAGADVVLSTWGAVPYTEQVLAGCPDFKLILYAAGSFKNQVTEPLVALRPTVCTAAHLNGIPTAEFTLGMILMALKDVFTFTGRIATDGREGWGRSLPTVGTQGYYRTTVGILGFGVVSRHLLRLLQNFEMDVYVADDFMSAEQAGELGARKADLDYVMAECDVITIHHADVERNWRIINERTLGLMKPGARLINTSRGRMIDEDALAAKLATGEITAYLDVTHPEPPEADHPFYRLPNCIMTPHLAGSIGNEVTRMGRYCLRELTAWIAGEPLEHPIDIASLADRA